DPLRLSYDDKGHALAETSAWIVLRQFNYTTDLLLWNRQRFERSDHPPLPNHPLEFHATAHRGTLLKRMLCRIRASSLFFPPILASSRASARSTYAGSLALGR